jgi:hypothetical protein
MTRTLALLALLSGCATTVPKVDLDAAWPAATPAYGAATERWTRRGGHSQDFTRVLDASATLASAEWRAAYAAERTRRLHLGAEAQAALAAEQQTAAAEGPIVIQLLVATARPEWNDLKKGKASIWRLALATPDGREVEPTEVREDRRPRDEVASWFPDLKPFYTPYVVSFPRAGADGRSLLEEKQLTLKIGGGLGVVELIWGE